MGAFLAGFRAWRKNLNADFEARQRAELSNPNTRYVQAAFRDRAFFAVMAMALGLGALMAGALQKPAPFFVSMWFTLIGYLLIVPRLPGFRAKVDAKLAATEAATTPQPEAALEAAVPRTLATLPLAAQQRFLVLRQRCADMRDIASDVRGETPDEEKGLGSVPELDRLLFLFLRLLISQRGLDRFLKSTGEPALRAEVDETKTRLAAAQTAADDRMVRSLQDGLGDAEQRLDHYRACARDAQFVAAELDRLETKIETLAEMGVNGQDAAAVRREITATVGSMEHAETAVDRLTHLSDLVGNADDVPPLLPLGTFGADAQVNLGR